MDCDPSSTLLQSVFATLCWVPWSGQLPLNTHSNTIDILKLSTFLTREWLSDDHELVMADLLKDDLLDQNHIDVYVESTIFVILLTAAHIDRKNYCTEKHYRW